MQVACIVAKSYTKRVVQELVQDMQVIYKALVFLYIL